MPLAEKVTQELTAQRILDKTACMLKQLRTLQVVSMSEIALRLKLAVWMMSSWRAEFPAATALAVAMVMPLVMRMNSSGVVVLFGASLDWNTWEGGEKQEVKTVKLVNNKAGELFNV